MQISQEGLDYIERKFGERARYFAADVREVVSVHPKLCEEVKDVLGVYSLTLDQFLNLLGSLQDVQG